jgi:hypothetical protein
MLALYCPLTLNKKERNVYSVMAILTVYKRNPTFIDVASLVEEISSVGLVDAIQKYHNKPLEKEVKSVVAGPSFLQFLNNYQPEILSNLNLEVPVTGTWDEIIKLQ